jgi:ABC-2 type transport system ATP-binding protein
LLMDEPTNGLDIPGKSQFRKFIASGMSDDKTIVISTHQVRDIDKVLDHVLIMDDSRVLLDESTSSICDKLFFVEMIGNWPKVRFLQFLLFRVTT